MAHKDEFKHDVVRESLVKTISYMKTNRTIIVRYLTIVVVAVVLLGIYNNHRQKTIAIANEEYGKAVNAFIDGNADLAAIDFQSIVDNYSGQPSALNAAIYLAQIGIKDKNYAEAEENIDKIIKNSDNPQILSSMWALKGNIAYAQGEFENCQKFYENAIKTQPLSAFADEYKVTLAKLYVDQSEFEKAKKLLDDILDNDELRFNIKNDAEDLLAEVSYLLR